jgi:hypothetical protein
LAVSVSWCALLMLCRVCLTVPPVQPYTHLNASLMGQQALVAATSPSAYIGPMAGLPTMAHSAATQGINGLASTIVTPTSGI